MAFGSFRTACWCTCSAFVSASCRLRSSNKCTKVDWAHTTFGSRSNWNLHIYPHLFRSYLFVFTICGASLYTLYHIILCGLAEAWNGTLANGLRAFFWPFSTLASAAAQSVVQAICPEVILIAFRSRNAFKPKAPIEFGPTLCDRQLTTIALARTKRRGKIHHVISIWHCAAKLQKLAEKFFHPFLLLHGLTLEVVTIRPKLKHHVKSLWTGNPSMMRTFTALACQYYALNHQHMQCVNCSSSCAGLCDSWPSGWCSCCGTWQGAPAKKYGHLMKSLHSEHAGRFGWFWSGLATFRLQRFEHSSLHQAQPHLQSWAVCDPKISISPKQNAQKIKLTLDKIELVTSQSFGVYKLDQYLLMLHTSTGPSSFTGDTIFSLSPSGALRPTACHDWQAPSLHMFGTCRPFCTWQSDHCY